MTIMENVQLLNKITKLPSELRSEVNDFVDFLVRKGERELEKKRPKFGCAKGQIYMSPDFDESLEDFNDYM